MNKNKSHWEKLGKGYSKAWNTSAKAKMSDKEKSFILKYVNKIPVRNILDIGVGNGRILDMYINGTNVNYIYGIDISSEMIKICKNKFKEEKRIKRLNICDISQEKIPYPNNFDFISAIRVLKYNKNWKEIIKKIDLKINYGGVFVFTMPNKKSVNIFWRGGLKYYRTNLKEIKKIIKENKNLELLEVISFTRIPDFFYYISDSIIYSKILLKFEELLSLLFGKTLFGRMFFIAVKKKSS